MLGACPKKSNHVTLTTCGASTCPGHKMRRSRNNLKNFSVQPSMPNPHFEPAFDDCGDSGDVVASDSFGL